MHVGPLAQNVRRHVSSRVDGLARVAFFLVRGPRSGFSMSSVSRSFVLQGRRQPAYVFTSGGVVGRLRVPREARVPAACAACRGVGLWPEASGGHGG